MAIYHRIFQRRADLVDANRVTGRVGLGSFPLR